MSEHHDADDRARRATLPLPDRASARYTAYEATDPAAADDPIRPLRPPAGAPNVLLVLLDDIGFGAAATFGGPVSTPTADRLAERGLRYTRFHTTALCAPTRAALLTGRNHHAVGMGAVTELATAAAGYSSVRPRSAAPLAEVLRLNGYSTAQFGKCHEVPVWEASAVGPFDAWPTGGGGMEHFYGFIGGETNQYYPSLYLGTTPVEPPRTPEEGYHLTEDLADHAVDWLRAQHSLASDRPFFLYFAPGATHAPHHVPPGWAERYAGAFDDGWDALRERTFARQKELGVIPADAELTARPAEIPAWDDMPAELKPVLARQMEIFAGFLEHTDHHVGRLVDTLEELGILEDTLVFYLIGDNGASAEGTINGSFNESFVFNGAAHLETPEFMASKIDEFGGPTAYNHYAVGWAHATVTPYQWTKQVASHWGGTRNAMIAHWPRGIDAAGRRDQFTHVVDIAPTVLELAGLPVPRSVNGIEQMPLHGTSLAPTFAHADAPESHDLQYFECFVNRGVYHRGWTAVTRHSTPWIVEPLPAIDDDVWELYGPDDWTQSRDLAAEHPEKLRELQRLFLIEAVKYGVLPLDDRRIERFNPDLAGRPTLIAGTTQRLFAGMGRLPENCVLNVKNRSFAITAAVDVPSGGAEGVVIAQGGAFGGWSLYLLGGRPAFCYNLFGLTRVKVFCAEPVPEGVHELRVEFAYDGGGLGRGGALRLEVDGTSVGEGRLEQTVPMIFSGDETTDIGEDLASPVSDDYPAGGNAFTGRIAWVQIDLGDDALAQDHLITAEDRLRIAMGRH
ncbi:arylsulfatase [Agromyces aurantiacus]|uniref:Arylsulfatase n=1 Tax=Agromyces aurantiacus TaxID=165814 RepID=A0ABV9R531_9MICO|nr:arylsulfatase [Agromyces aurantiacus]MBM7503390.1 arylsulfatase [Agromyces aurantiacus]